MDTPKSDFIGGFTLSAANVLSVLKAAGTNGERFFNAIAAFGGTTTTPPLSLAQKAQTYTTTTQAQVDGVLKAASLRGHPSYEVLITVATPVGGIQSPNINSGFGQNVYGFEGQWPGGTAIRVNLSLTDPDGQSEGDMFDVVLPAGSHTSAVASSVVCAEIDALVHYRCERVGATITISPAAAQNSITSSLTIG